MSRLEVCAHRHVYTTRFCSALSPRHERGGGSDGDRFPRLLSAQMDDAAFRSRTFAPNSRPILDGHRDVTPLHVLDIAPALAG
jgi:hypothetical protein